MLTTITINVCVAGNADRLVCIDVRCNKLWKYDSLNSSHTCRVHVLQIQQ